MDKVLFKSIEEKLYDYFSKDKKISGIKNKINLLQNQKESIEFKLKNTDISIPVESRSMVFKEKVSFTSDGTSYMERTMIKIIDGLLIEKTRKEEEIIKLEELIRNIEEDNSMLKSKIETMEEEDIRLLKMKYKERLKDWQIGVKMNVHQTTISRQRQRLIKDIVSWNEDIMCIKEAFN
ncbi:hypothetical protein [Clostridium hydrogeniformans]|uniref:hypothetical protein n=1 Tax=Clostridium hydrogeniformans TaxID=349933 RepID=UPI0004899537|nr:hypothetical protein [Clostridium hydrogeniformans]